MITNNHEINCEVTLNQLAKELMPNWKMIEWFAWPPDLFALTSIYLKATGIYRYVVSPHPYNNRRLECKWRSSEEIDSICEYWFEWILGRKEKLPGLLLNCYKILFAQNKNYVNSESISYEDCCLILKLHIISDAACGGFGISSTAPYGQESSIYFLANYLLNITCSLSRLPKRHGFVLPKMRTPQNGLTIRSFSHDITYHRSEVNVLWRTVPWDDRNEKTVNIMVIPFPYRLDSKDFCPTDYCGPKQDYDKSRYFKYNPSKELDVNEVISLLREAHKEVERVHILVFPELALAHSDLIQLKKQLIEEIESPHQIPMIITGVRSNKDNKEINQVKLSIFFANKWYDMGQDKHHRWKLDSNQIKQYSLGGILNVKHDWWEAIDIPNRQLTFLVPNGWLTLCPLICEDLAQLEPVSEIIRGVGPTIVIALLMDGPQLSERWSARYVGVLADDPGTSILTVTSLGMALRSRAKGKPESRVVAFWKDIETGSESIELKPNKKALLLNVTADTKEEFTADGRSDDDVAAYFKLNSVHSLPSDEIEENGLNLEKSKESKKNKQRVIYESSSNDLKELTAFCFLTDAIIDAPENLIREFRIRVFGEEDIKKEEIISKIRPFNSIWELIVKYFGKDPKWKLEDFNYTVNLLCNFIEPINTDLNRFIFPQEDSLKDNFVKKEKELEQLRRWNIIFDEAKRLLNQDPIIEEEYSAVNNIQTMEKNRLYKVTYLSVIWALYNRLMSVRHEPEWTDIKEYSDLRKKIDKWMISKSSY